MRNDKLTVIIPYYNRESVIRETIESIQEQTRKDIRILLIDDGSTDNIKKILDDLNTKHDNIDYIYKNNGGVSSARNLGIENSKTEYICFLDSDDLYTENFVKIMLRDIEETNSDISFCSYNFYNNGNVTEAKTSFNNKNIILDFIKGKGASHISCFVFRRDLIKDKDIRFDESLSWGEDVYFLVKAMSNAKKISTVPMHLTMYRTDDSDYRLSNYKPESLAKDKLFINELLQDPEVRLNDNEVNAFTSYRLPALLTYGLLILMDQNYPKDQINQYYKEYKHDIDNFKLTFDLRSVKLLLNIIKLKIKMKFN